MTSIGRLDLSSTRVSGPGLEHLKELRIGRLYLNNTPISDAGLSHLSGCVNIREIRLVNTKITDAGLVHLKGMTNLKSLYLHNTTVTDAGANELNKALPDLMIAKSVDGNEPSHDVPDTGKVNECLDLVGTSWKGKVTQGITELDVLISFSGVGDGHGHTMLGVSLEFPNATEDVHKQLKSFFEVHQGFNRRWHKPDKAKQHQYLLTIHRGGVPAIPVPWIAFDSRGRLFVRQLWSKSDHWGASCRLELQRADNKLNILLVDWRGGTHSHSPKHREMAKAVQRDTKLELVRQPARTDQGVKK